MINAFIDHNLNKKATKFGPVINEFVPWIVFCVLNMVLIIDISY